MFRFSLIFYFVFFSLIYIKNLIVPALLFLLLPVSDFRSTLFEIFILITGVIAGVLYFLFGSLAKEYYRFSPFLFGCTLTVIFTPLIIAMGFNHSGFGKWSILWSDLLGEAVRILTFTYSSSLYLGMFLPILLTSGGYYLTSQYDSARKPSTYPTRSTNIS